ncbi:MAG: alpha/beta fold hydrolase [Caulobacteraceae bacterium]
MPSVSRGESRLYFEEYGEGSPVVFLHGVGGNHASWFNQVPAFSERHRVIVLDQRGFGNSPDLEGLGRSAFVDDLEVLLDHLGLERCFLVAQSMGGGTATGFTCTHPRRVAGLVLCDTLVGIKAPKALESTLEATLARTANLSQAERVLGPKTRAADRERTLLYLQIASFNSVNVRTVKGKFDLHKPEDLAATGVPILFVAGEDDVLFEASSIRAVSEATVGSRYVEIAGAGHSAYFEAPARFNSVVLEFLAGL